MANSQELIEQQAKQILELLPADDRLLVEAHIADRVAGQDLAKMRWAAVTGSLTIVASVATVVGIVALLIYFVALLPSGASRCEGWCARNTEGYLYTDGGRYSHASCTCVTPADPTRIWHP